MLKRQRVVLGALSGCGKVLSRLELTKWMFLLKQETCFAEDTTFYDFIPYKYGPFSYALYRELGDLSRNGFIVGENLEVPQALRYEALKTFRSLPSAQQNAVADIIARFSPLTREALLKYVYYRYPWYATRSELVANPVAGATVAPIRVYTIGYEGKSIDSFLGKLMKRGLKCLVDVRYNPLSRKYGFSGKSLRKLCLSVDISYKHFQSLGIPPNLRTSLESFKDYQRLLRRYETTILPKSQSFLSKLGDVIKTQPTAILCFEADSRCCHRERLAEALAERTGLTIENL